MSDSTSESRPLAGNPIVTGIVGFCLGLLIAYGVGLWQRSSALAEAAEAHAAVVAAKDAELSAAAAKLAESELATRAASARVALVQARLGLHQALNDLDQRNFGVAADRLREAASRFDGIDAAALGLDPALLAALQSEIAGTQVLVASDFEQQRLQILELAARIEAQTAGAVATPAVGAPDQEP
jgi:hypothetical protein